MISHPRRRSRCSVGCMNGQVYVSRTFAASCGILSMYALARFFGCCNCLKYLLNEPCLQVFAYLEKCDFVHGRFSPSAVVLELDARKKPHHVRVSLAREQESVEPAYIAPESGKSVQSDRLGDVSGRGGRTQVLTPFALCSCRSDTVSEKFWVRCLPRPTQWRTGQTTQRRAGH